MIDEPRTHLDSLKGPVPTGSFQNAAPSFVTRALGTMNPSKMLKL